MKLHLATTRFSDATWAENCTFRARCPADKIGCVYASPFPLQVPHGHSVLVLEMNNSANRIMGIGWIRNRPVTEKYRLYSKESYNRYVFAGKFRLDRADLTDVPFLARLETFCFRGKGHQKRLRGITRLPQTSWRRKEEEEEKEQEQERQYDDVVKLIFDAFRNRFGIKAPAAGEWANS